MSNVFSIQVFVTQCISRLWKTQHLLDHTALHSIWFQIIYFCNKIKIDFNWTIDEAENIMHNTNNGNNTNINTRNNNKASIYDCNANLCNYCREMQHFFLFSFHFGNCLLPSILPPLRRWRWRECWPTKQPSPASHHHCRPVIIFIHIYFALIYIDCPSLSPPLGQGMMRLLHSKNNLLYNSIIIINLIY